MATASVSIVDQLGLQPLDELTKYLNILLYGPPNAGKTFLSSTADDHPDFSPAFHMGFEQGLLTVAWRDGYAAKEIRTITQFEEVVKLLQEDNRSKKPHFKSLIVDNATELQNLDIDTVMREAKKLAKNPDHVDIDVPSPREWGKIGKRLRRCVVALRDLEMHSIWTAWRGEYTDDMEITHYFPKLAGHMKHEFSGYFDIVGYVQLDTKKVEDKTVPYQTVQVQETKRVKAKWRNKPEEVPAVLENPTIGEIWEFVRKSKIGKPISA